MHTFSHVSFKFPTPRDKHVSFVAKMSPPLRKLKKDHLSLFFIQNAPIDVKLAGGEAGHGAWGGFLLLLTGAPNDSMFLKTSEVYQMVFYKR